MFPGVRIFERIVSIPRAPARGARFTPASVPGVLRERGTVRYTHTHPAFEPKCPVIRLTTLSRRLGGILKQKIPKLTKRYQDEWTYNHSIISSPESYQQVPQRCGASDWEQDRASARERDREYPSAVMAEHRGFTRRPVARVSYIHHRDNSWR